MANPLSTPPTHLDLRRLSCEIVVINGRDPQSVYRATCSDAETGIVLGSRLLPAGPGGAAPAVTLGDVVALIGGGYRCASVAVEIEAESLSRQTRRVGDILRTRRRLWRRRRRRVRRAIAFESPLEAALLAEVSS